jgi:integrase
VTSNESDPKPGREAPREELYKNGTRATRVHPSTLVRVYVERGRVWLQYPTAANRRAKRSWPDSKASRKFALTAAREVLVKLSGQTMSEDMTLNNLWEKYTKGHLRNRRERTKELYAEGWKHFVDFNGGNMLASSVTPMHLEEFANDLLDRKVRGGEKGYAVRTIRGFLGTVRTVIRYGELHRLIPKLNLSDYRFSPPKDALKESPGEYSAEEWMAILEEVANPTPLPGKKLGVRRKRPWRTWGAIALAGLQGTRINAVLHLRLADFNFKKGTIRLDPKWDKTANGAKQPMSENTRAVLERVLEERKREGCDSDWLFPASTPGQSEPYDYQIVWWMLCRAELGAGIEHEPGRAAHGFRRLVAGDVAELTGNATLAMHVIGDKDPGQVKSYVKARGTAIKNALAVRDERLKVTGIERIFRDFDSPQAME